VRASGIYGPGVEFDVDLSSDASCVDLFLSQYEPPCLAPIVEAALAKGGVFYDVGANVGLYSLWAAKLVSPTGEVHAFEPAAVPRALLEQLVAQNPGVDVRVVPSAVGAVEGSATIWVRPGHSGISSLDPAGSTPVGQQVGLTTLDRYAATHEPPDLIKIDVEGHELAVLEGARELLATATPVVVMEVERGAVDDTQPTLMKLRALVSDAGYDVWLLAPRGLRRYEPGQRATPNVLCLHADRHRGLREELSSRRFRRNQTR
jgi:FkbM family methyltransferase